MSPFPPITPATDLEPLFRASMISIVAGWIAAAFLVSIWLPEIHRLFRRLR